MKKVFSKENIVTFVLVALACAVGVVVIVPVFRKVVPGMKKTTTTAATTAATA